MSSSDKERDLYSTNFSSLEKGVGRIPVIFVLDREKILILPL